MTVKIIKRGILPEDEIHYTSCRNCKTEFSFQKADAKLNFDTPGVLIILAYHPRFVRM